ncbi:MAG: hypothetical protein GY842_09390 [bacterium]|nr:hypothetical protein [bacterium]
MSRAIEWPRMVRPGGIVLGVAVVLLTGACAREAAPTGDALPVEADPSPIDFPREVQADAPEVNRFVREVVETCAGGDYESFRLLWSVHENPFPRAEFERGWKALRKVRVLALDKYKTPEGEYLYSIHARVELDQELPDPVREVVLLVVQENGQWRLKTAPSYHQQRVLGAGDEEAAGQTEGRIAPTTLPASP